MDASIVPIVGLWADMEQLSTYFLAWQHCWVAHISSYCPSKLLTLQNDSFVSKSQHPVKIKLRGTLDQFFAYEHPLAAYPSS